MTRRITSAEVIVCAPGRNFVTLKITTDDGLIGWGDATLNGRELAVASYLSDHIAPLLIGRDAQRIEDTWQYFSVGGYWRRGPVTMAAISAIDMALWDIAAKAAGVPLYQLLGGASRDRIRTYGHAMGRTVDELADSVQALVDAGFTAVRIQTGVPGIDTAYGVPDGDGRYEPASAGSRPVEEAWDTPAYLRHMPRVFAEIRERFGEDLDLLHDVHHRLTPIEAAQLGRSLEPHRPFWIEDATPAENPESFRVVRAHTTAPLATGEVFNSIHDYRQLIGEQLIDYSRSAVTHVGGVSALKRLAEFGELYGVRLAPHGPTDISPIGLAATLHIDLAVHGFGIQEFMPRDPVTLDAFPNAFRFEAGHLHPGDAPGHGASLDEDFAEEFAYAPAYLPVNRLTDGTLHDW